MTATFEIHNNKRCPIGIEGAAKHILGGHETYRGLHITVERQIAEDEWVVTQIIERGTYVGSWLGIRPTGKDVEFTCVNVNRFVGGRIVEHGGLRTCWNRCWKSAQFKLSAHDTCDHSLPTMPRTEG
jgi:predicted ester cyclase